MVASRRSMLLTTMGLSGAALAAGVAEAPAADAAAYALTPGTTQALGSVSVTAALDLSVADTFTCTLTGNTVFTFTYSGTVPSPAVTIEPTVILTQDSVGGHQASFNNNVTWLPDGTIPAFPLAAGQSGIACFLTPDFGTTVYGQGALETGGGGEYGDGSDGALVLDGTTPNPYSAFIGTGSQANYYWALRDIYASSVTIAAGCTLQLAGGGTAAYRLYCSGTVTNNSGSIVTVVNKASSGATPGSNDTNGSLVQGATGATGSTANSKGAAGTNAFGIWGKGATYAAGAGGANSAGTAGGAGGSAVPPTNMPAGTLPRALPQAATMSVVDGTGTPRYFGGGASGGAGAGDGTNAGGAGGPGGNPLFIAAQAIVNNGTGVIKATGGTGGAAAGGNAGGGGGGQGGAVMLITGSITGTGTVTAPGGPGGAKAGSGVAGQAGASGWIVMLQN